MSSDSHEHGPPEVEPDLDDYSAIQKLIAALIVFVVVSMVGVGWWLDGEIERVQSLQRVVAQ